MSKREVDVLDEDQSINGQKFVCLSFLSPEKLLKKKELFFMNSFFKFQDMNLSVNRFQAFLNFLSYKYDIEFNKITEDFEEYFKSEKGSLENINLEDDYKSYLDKEEDRLTKEFNKQNNFQTNVRGIKVRGSYDTVEEAELRCKKLRQLDPNHDIFVGPVGVWMPWDPDAYKTGRVEYMEKELNDLMKEKLNNQEKAKEEFEQRVKESKMKAIEENKAKAKESGVKLTQNIKPDGTLYKTNTSYLSNVVESIEQNIETSVQKNVEEKESIKNEIL